jgi:myosin-9
VYWDLTFFVLIKILCHSAQEYFHLEDAEDLRHEFERLHQAMEMVGFLPSTKKQYVWILLGLTLQASETECVCDEERKSEGDRGRQTIVYRDISDTLSSPLYIPCTILLSSVMIPDMIFFMNSFCHSHT